MTCEACEKHISIIRSLEERNEQLMRLDELKTNLTSFIIHDLKGPISAIIGNLDMLSCEPLTPQQLDYLNISLGDAYRLQRMALNILDVLKLEDSMVQILREKTDMRALAEKEAMSFKSILSRRNIELAVEGSPRLCSIDKSLIGRTISNLLLNAIEHSPDNARITISIEHDNNRKETVVAVSDQGPGVPVELREKIFDKFFQAAEGRKHRKTTTGLGLTFCKLAVNDHGGNIRVEDAEPCGARFVFILPDFPFIEGGDF
jgi:signal transduction histidine kinase